MVAESIDDLMANIELFGGLDAAERRRLTTITEATHFKADQLLFSHASPRTYLYIIRDGQVALSTTTPFGAERRLIVFGKYDLLGERALIDDAPHSTTATALTDTTAVTLHRDKLLEFLKANPPMAAKIFVQVAKLIARRMDQAAAPTANETAQQLSGRTRTEHDLLGERAVPFEAYYGVQTFRALENFPITGVPVSHYPELVNALAAVKMAAAKANLEFGLLPRETADAIIQACSELIHGKWRGQFVVDLVQGGAGTSTNMNANEVIANRALEILGHERGEYDYCHPNNHVNPSVA